ncbi:glycosyltransferase [Neoroseomonas soli]|uniref:Glycosyltransferase family 2 protein n=1 Tax=Neoroseomonas soli TaxID=1081025 RepID=A0A9X9WSM8_9PROT|nr:glycosyltransferase family A protein [Neoroseomonas soli]MBR0670157.1 glycosyltransferase family 2 protein [Neoroseomonas soli]
MTTPTLSIVICTANRADALAAALASIARARMPGVGTELLVVDNGSTDHTRAVVEAAQATMPLPLRYLHEPRRGLGNARNCGLFAARGEIIAHTDDDCLVAEDWIERILGNLAAAPEIDFLSGRADLHDPADLPVSIMTSDQPAVMGPRDMPYHVVIGCNMAFRRRVAERIGGWDPRFGAGAPLRAAEEIDFAYRASRAGFRVVYRPDVVVRHHHGRRGVEQVLNLRQGYAYAGGALLMKHMLAGDGLAARYFAWSIIHMLGRVPARTEEDALPGGGRLRLRPFLGGAWRFLWQGRRLPGPPPPSSIAGAGAQAGPAFTGPASDAKWPLAGRTHETS